MVIVIKKGIKKEEFDKKLSVLTSNKGLDSHKFCGIIKLMRDPVVIQKKMRDEWE